MYTSVMFFFEYEKYIFVSALERFDGFQAFEYALYVCFSNVMALPYVSTVTTILSMSDRKTKSEPARKYLRVLPTKHEVNSK